MTESCQSLEMKIFITEKLKWQVLICTDLIIFPFCPDHYTVDIQKVLARAFSLHVLLVEVLMFTVLDRHGNSSVSQTKEPVRCDNRNTVIQM